jgi:hypothetical protein
MQKPPPIEQSPPVLADATSQPTRTLAHAFSFPERRDAGTRWALLHRIWDEFDEMPGTALTLPQASRLFGIRPDVCDRILVSFVDQGRLRRTQDGRFRLRSLSA